MYELHFADQQHHACEAVQVPVPVHGCLPLGYLRHFFPGATSLHYIYQGNLVSVSHSIPYTSGRFDTSRVVFHLPKDFPVLNILVSSVHMLDNLIKTDSLRYDSITLFIERLNSKLKSMKMLVDCASIVLDDLFRLVHMVEKDSDHVHELLIKFSQENWDIETLSYESGNAANYTMKPNYAMDGIKLALERINAELKSKNITLDCTHLVLEKLYKLEQWIDEQDIKIPALNNEVNNSEVNNSELGLLINNTRPKLIRNRTEVIGVKRLKESYRISDINSNEDKVKVKATIEKANHKVLNTVSGAMSNIVSSRPKLRKPQSERQL